MSDTQAAMREFRFLDEKRKTSGLLPQEEQRWQELAAHLGIDISQAMGGYWGADGQWYAYPQQQPQYDPNAYLVRDDHGRRAGHGPTLNPNPSWDRPGPGAGRYATTRKSRELASKNQFIP